MGRISCLNLRAELGHAITDWLVKVTAEVVLETRGHCFLVHFHAEDN